MDVPENLRKIMASKDAESYLDVVSSIVTPEKKGELISITALVEEEVTRFIVRYFAVPSRAKNFEKILLKKINFNAKIEVLEKLLKLLDSDFASHENHRIFVRALQKIRNRAGHSYGVTSEELNDLKNIPEVVYIVTNFPTQLWGRVGALKQYLDSLNVG